VSQDYSIRDDIDVSASIYNSDEVALVRITEQRDIILEELRITKENLEAEKKITHELNQRLIMKAISIDCQLADTEDQFKKSKAKIASLTRKTEDLSTQVRILTRENESLLKRTAALARRDQIQKATILTSNTEIIKLMSTIEAFQERFLTLADAVVTVNENNSEEVDIALAKNTSSDGSEDSDTMIPKSKSMTPFERDNVTPNSSSSQGDKIDRAEEEKQKQEQKQKQKQEEEKRKQQKEQQKELQQKEREHSKKLLAWQNERRDLFGCIQKLKSNNSEIKSKFVQTLKKHQWKWHKEKEKLLKKVGDLEVMMAEKEAELLLMTNALAEASGGGGLYPDKRGLNQADTFGTLTTTEDSLSTASSSSSLTLTYSLTETSNNLSKVKVNEPKLDIVEPIDLDNYSYTVLAQFKDTPPRVNGRKDTD